MRIKLAKLHNQATHKGEAYAFMDIKDDMSISDIEKELEHIEENKLKYNLDQGLRIYAAKTNPADVHPDLDKYKDKAGDYVLKAILPGATNEETAQELGQAMNLLYKGLEYKDSEPTVIEAGYIEHNKLHYEDKEKFHHLRKKPDKK